MTWLEGQVVSYPIIAEWYPGLPAVQAENDNNRSKNLMWLFIGWNVLTFLVTGYDKLIAGARIRRVRERTLLGLALLFGALGVYIAMQLFRHKTQHKKFRYGVPVLLAVNFIGLYLVAVK